MTRMGDRPDKRKVQDEWKFGANLTEDEWTRVRITEDLFGDRWYRIKRQEERPVTRLEAGIVFGVMGLLLALIYMLGSY